MPYYKNGMKAAFSIVLLLTKIQKGFIKFLEPADCGMFCPNSIAVVRYGALIRVSAFFHSAPVDKNSKRLYKILRACRLWE